MTTETWTSVADAGNGYVVSDYAKPVYVSGAQGVSWSGASGNSETWANQTDDYATDGFVKVRYVVRDQSVPEIWTVIGP